MKTILTIFLFCKILLFSASNSLYAQKTDTIPKISFSEIKCQDEFNKGLIADPIQLILGKVPGVSITKRGSDPNVSNGIYIRGFSSNYSDGPLYIIDGVWDTDPQLLTPYEIESIEILKDAASTARYGSRGMNGVIIINTKSTQGTKPISIDFNSNLSLNTVAKRMDLLSANELRNFVKRNNISFEDGGYSTNWQDEIFRNTLSQNHHISTYGQVNNTGYRLSFNHSDYSGVVLGSDRSNSGLNMSLSQKTLNNRLNVSAIAGIRYSNSNTLPYYNGMDRYNIFYQAYQRNPTDPVYDADGTNYAQSSRAFNYENPLAVIKYTGNENTSNVLNYSLNANYIITNSILFDFRAGYSKSNIKNNRWEKPEALSSGLINRESGDDFVFERFNLCPSIKYDRIINEKHWVTFRAEYLYRSVKNNYSTWEKDISWENSYKSHNQPIFNSVIASAFYEYDERYFVFALWNRENYSLYSSPLDELSLGSIKRLNNYPAFTGGWNVHNEAFMSGIEIINYFTLKGGYGYSGNSNFHLIYPNPITVNTDDLETERMNELSLGLYYGFWNNRLTGSFVYYARNANNVLGKKSVPIPPNLNPFIYSNVFHYKNNGFELGINALAIQKERISWYSSIIYSRNNNELISGIVEENGIRSGYINYYHLTQFSYTQVFRTGSPPFVFYLPTLVDISDDGYHLYLTDSGNLTREIIRAKRMQMGHITPRHELGWGNRFSILQRFDLELSIRYIQGHSIFNATRMAMSNSQMLPNLNVIPEGTHNYDTGKHSINYVSDFYLEDASYLRLDYITFGYTLNPKFNKLNADLRVYFCANNLITLTNYSGLDPAYDYQGVDYFNVYPLARSFVFGINLSI